MGTVKEQAKKTKKVVHEAVYDRLYVKHVPQPFVVFTIAFLITSCFAVIISSITLNANHQQLSDTLCSSSLHAKPRTEVERIISNIQKKMQVAITFNGETVTASLSDLGVVTDIDATVEKAISDNNERTGLTNLNPFPTCETSIVASYSIDSLTTFLKDAFPIAGLTYQSPEILFEDGRFIVSEGKAGTFYDLAPIIKAIDQTTRKPQKTTATIKIVQTTPGVEDITRLNTITDELNYKISQTYGTTIDGHDFYQLTPADVASVIKLVPDYRTNTYAIDYNRQMLTNIINIHVVEPATVTVQDTKYVTTPWGDRFLAVQGWNGQVVNNTEDIIDTLLACIQNSSSTSVDVTRELILAKVVDEETSGDRWIDINLSARLVTAYIGDTAVRSFVVNIGAPYTPTVTGTFRVYAKYTVTAMEGGGGDTGLEYYYLDGIHWTMYFYQGYAFHEAWWFSRGEINGRQTSHGCVNMTYDDSKWLFDFAPLGTLVYSHY